MAIHALASSLPDLRAFIKQHRVDLVPYEKLYKEFHTHPELSGHEKTTAARIAELLRGLGLTEIHTGVGGHGIASVLRNGPGPTILLRADIDGLPIEEQTGLPYASKARQVDADGKEKPVMHACAHDMHIVCMLAVAETLFKTQSSWGGEGREGGTVIFLFQPAEETFEGASAMVEDGLYEKVPVPEYVLGQHCMFDRAGTVNICPGAIEASADNLKITFFGRGAHAGLPHYSVDPIIMASSAVLRLQTIVSREIAASERAVVSVSTFHGGSAENVIPSEVTIQVNVRTSSEEVRAKVLAAIKRIVRSEAQTSGVEKEPLIESKPGAPTLFNDPANTMKLSEAFTEYFGDEFDSQREPVMGSEDFGHLATAIDKPGVYWFFGGNDPERYDDAKRRGKLLEDLPMNHSAKFAPVIRPTLDRGVDAMLVAALTFLRK